MRTLHLGPDELLVAAKIEFDRDLTVPALAAAINDVRGDASAPPCPIARVIYLEPDLAAEATTPPAERPDSSHEGGEPLGLVVERATIGRIEGRVGLEHDPTVAMGPGPRHGAVHEEDGRGVGVLAC